MATATITLPAHAADTLCETITLAAPPEWHPRITALAAHLAYGPDYRRAVMFNLVAMSENVAGGYSALGYERLEAAEAAAAR